MFLLFDVGFEVSQVSCGYTYLLENRHERDLLAGGIVSGYWLGLTLGRFILSNIAGRLRLGLSGLMYTCMGGIVLGILMIWLVPGVVASAVAFCLTGLSLGPIYPSTVALVPDIVPSRMVSTAIAFPAGLRILVVAPFPVFTA